MEIYIVLKTIQLKDSLLYRVEIVLNINRTDFRLQFASLVKSQQFVRNDSVFCFCLVFDLKKNINTRFVFLLLFYFIFLFFGAIRESNVWVTITNDEVSYLVEKTQ